MHTMHIFCPHGLSGLHTVLHFPVAAAAYNRAHCVRFCFQQCNAFTLTLHFQYLTRTRKLVTHSLDSIIVVDWCISKANIGWHFRISFSVWPFCWKWDFYFDSGENVFNSLLSLFILQNYFFLNSHFFLYHFFPNYLFIDNYILLFTYN